MPYTDTDIGSDSDEVAPLKEPITLYRRRVAVAFENALDPGEWHKQLLGRMALDIPTIRPALIDGGLRAQLDELRKFRHFFRNVYDRELNPAKVAEILQLQGGLHGDWTHAIERFLNWLDELVATALGKQS